MAEDRSTSRPMVLDESRSRASDVPATQEDLSKVDRRLASCELEVSNMNKMLAANTVMTAETKEVLDAVKAGLLVLGYIGKAAQWAARLATAVAAIYAAWQLIRHGQSK
jgi:hypothetical protein